MRTPIMRNMEIDALKPTLVIMAAGMGSRYGGLKQMDPVGPNGETLLEYSIHDAIKAGFGKVVFVIRTDFEGEFRAQVGNRFAGRIEVDYAFQALDNLPPGYSVPAGRTKPWGTGQAVLACKELVHEPFAVQNADDFYGAEAYQTIADAFERMPEGESCMVGYRIRNTLSPHGSVSRGVCETIDGYLSGINERTHIETDAAGVVRFFEDGTGTVMTGDETCSMNFWGFHPTFFQTLEAKFAAFLDAKGQELKSEWYIPNIVDEMINRRETRVKVLSCESQWFGVTYPEDRPTVVAALEAMHNEGKYPSPLWD
jgi:NDP-sugar pyrophosphorylase family protein